MDSANYELDLPRENIHIRCFAHNIMNYRYHWHADDYELSILLYGVRPIAAAPKTACCMRMT